MDRVAEGVVERAEIARNGGIELPDVGGWDTDVICKGSIGVYAKDFDELADVRLSAAALQAVTAGDVHFGRDEVADGDALDQTAYRRDGTAELVAGDVGRLDAGLCPLVPVEDMQIGAADGGGFDSYQNIGGTDIGYRHLAHFHAGGCGCLYQCLHCFRNHWGVFLLLRC